MGLNMSKSKDYFLHEYPFPKTLRLKRHLLVNLITKNDKLQANDETMKALGNFTNGCVDHERVVVTTVHARYIQNGFDELKTRIYMRNLLNENKSKYTKISAGYMGQLVEWPEVITEGKTLEECREMLKDALHEMILSYQQQSKEIPLGGGILEQIPVEI